MLTLAKVIEVAKLIGLGVPEEYACIHKGVSYQAFQKAKERRPDFVEAIKKERSNFLVHALNVIKAGGEKVTVMAGEGLREVFRPWQSYAWILERRHKEHFGKTEINVEVNQTNTNNVLQLTEAMQADLERAARQLYIPPQNGGRN